MGNKQSQNTTEPTSPKHETTSTSSETPPNLDEPSIFDQPLPEVPESMRSPKHSVVFNDPLNSLGEFVIYGLKRAHLFYTGRYIRQFKPGN